MLLLNIDGNPSKPNTFPYYWSEDFAPKETSKTGNNYYNYLKLFEDEAIVFPNLLFTTDKYSKDENQDYERFHSYIIRLSGGTTINKNASVISQLDLTQLI